MGLVLGGRTRVVLTCHADASWVDDLATQRSSQGYTFSLGSGSVSWRSTRSSSVLSSSCEAGIYAGAMAAQELRLLTYLLTDLGEAPHSPPVLAPKPTGGLTECREPASRPVSPVRTARRAPRSRPPSVHCTHAVALRPSFVPLCVPLPAPPESSLPKVPDPASGRARAASPTVSCLLAIAVTDPSFESAAVSALVAVLLDFAAACRLDYVTTLVFESVSASPSSVGGECALGTDVLEERQEDFECLVAVVPRFASMLLAPEGDPDAPDIPTPRSYAEAITGPYSSQWQAAMDAEMASWKSTGTYVDEFPPSRVNIVDGMKFPCLSQGNGALCSVPGDPQAKIACQLTQVCARVSHLELCLHVGECLSVRNSKDQVVYVHENVERRLSGVSA
ncbi:unnamed protein product [Closterium sp. NIES-54]